MIRKGKIIKQKPKHQGEDNNYVARGATAMTGPGGVRRIDWSDSSPGSSQPGGSFH